MTCYPKISDLINDWLGTNINLPIQSFGFFVAMAFGVGAWMLVRELKRKEKAGLLMPRTERVLIGAPVTPWELLSNALVGFVLGYKLVPIISHWQTFSDDPQHFLFAANGSAVAGIIGALLLGGLKYWEKKREQLDPPVWKETAVWPHERIGDIVTVAAIFGIIGARVMVLIENGGWEEFFINPGANFFSGLSIYGGLLLGAPAVIWYTTRKGISFYHLGDAVAPGLITAYGVGRIGCQVSGDGDWGVVNLAPKPGWLSWAPDWLWAFNYPNNVNGWCSPTGPGPDAPACSFFETPFLIQPVFPTPIYEIIMVAFIATFLIWISRRLPAPGMLFGIYMMFNGAERLAIEQIRINTPYPGLGGLTQAELIAILLFLGGMALVLHARNRVKRNPELRLNRRTA
jgi:prolipoprotein diacylglyceryltransferase